MYITHFVYSSVDGYLACFHPWAIVNNAIMNIGIQHVTFLLIALHDY